MLKAPKRVAKLLLLACLSWRLLVPELLLGIGIVVFLSPTVAIAQDNDDLDDDDDDDDDDGGFDVDDLDDYDDDFDDDDDDFDDLRDDLGVFDDDLIDDEGFLAATSEIIAFDVDPDELRTIESLGFRLLERQPLKGVAGTIDRLEAPAEFATLEQALGALRAAVPAAPFDVNHLYDLPEIDPTVVGPDIGERRLGGAQAGKGVRIGIIDTLVDSRHPSLAASSITVRDFAGDGDRDRIHATAVASILVGRDDAASYVGLLPKADLFAANVFALDANGRPRTDTYSMIRALDWLAENRVGVISVSIAGPPSSALEAMLGRLRSLGHGIVAAVGNDGPAAPPLFPAAYEDVTGVTAVDAELRVYRRAGRGEHVDYAALGVRVRAAAATGQYGAFTGTSFATPVIAALLAEGLPTADPAKIGGGAANRRIRDLGRPGRDEVYGEGLLLADGQ